MPAEKVYVVRRFDNDGTSDILGVFSTSTAAGDACARHPQGHHCGVFEFTLDPKPEPPDVG